MRFALGLIAAVLAVPLLTLAVLYACAGKVVVLHDTGPQSFEAYVHSEDGPYFENTDRRRVKAGSWDWLIFFPKIKGPLSLRCVDGGGRSSVPIGPLAPPRFLYASVTLKGCGHVVSRSGFGL